MELQSRPEALSVELARHQNGDLKKQLHERQPRIATLSDKQALGTITAVPVSGPQVSSLQRLAGQGAAVLPQVRPKTLIPDSLPVTPGRDRPPKQPPAFQKATVVSIKNPSPALPTANNTLQFELTPVGSEPTAIASPLSSAGVAYAIISTSPSNATAIAPSTTVPVVSESLQVQPLLISADSKVSAPQPQNAAEPPPGRWGTRAEAMLTRPPLSFPQKVAFMVALGLVTTEHLEGKGQQAGTGHEAERGAGVLGSSGFRMRLLLGKAFVPRPAFVPRDEPEERCTHEITQDEHCDICKRGASLQPCGTCPGAYHLSCLDPPLKTAPKGVWMCPRCQQKALKKDEGVPWTGMLAIVHSYVTHKTEEEKQKMLRRGGGKCSELKTSLLARQRGTQSSLDRLRALLRLIQGEQMLQVAMAATSPTPLLAGPWTKPSAATMRSTLQHPQGHN
uniref:PHD finger protein 21B n=1 Tax=Spermophilus dauricus TaxID=99837 RepID=A0A8C9PB13_SPEDA